MKLRKFAAIALILVLTLSVLSSCAPKDATQSKGGISIVSTVFPSYDFARQITAGTDADVTLLLQPGEEVHSFDPTSQDIIRVQNADLFLYVGGENDTWVNGVLSGTLNSLGVRPFYTREQKKNALTQIERVGMLPLKNAAFRELSGGQQQRALLARALAATKMLLILDEPIASLDPVAAADMYRLIEEINRDHGVTVVMVSHDPHAAAHEAKSVLHLENRQLFYGTSADYRKSEIGKRFLGGEGR